MRIKKKELFEIIDSNGDLIGKNDIPTAGADRETHANNTTDYNVKVGSQPFRYDMLGRFGFTLLPFFEGKEYNEGQKKMFNDLANLMFDRYKEILEFYYRNPNKLKSDFRKLSNDEADSKKEVNFDYAKKIINIIQKHFEDAFNEPEQIDENSVSEDKMIDSKTERGITKKDKDKGVQDKQVAKIAGLINQKFNKQEIDKLINLLERGNG